MEEIVLNKAETETVLEFHALWELASEQKTMRKQVSYMKEALKKKQKFWDRIERKYNVLREDYDAKYTHTEKAGEFKIKLIKNQKEEKNEEA